MDRPHRTAAGAVSITEPVAVAVAVAVAAEDAVAVPCWIARRHKVNSNYIAPAGSASGRRHARSGTCVPLLMVRCDQYDDEP